jgi:hypothetical protein
MEHIYKILYYIYLMNNYLSGACRMNKANIISLICLTFLASGLVGCVHDRQAPSANPPGGLKPYEVPMFVAFGFDDNGYSGLEGSGGEGGVQFVLDSFNSKRNPEGRGNTKTFDGSSVLVTFFLKADNIDANELEDNSLLKKSWRQAYTNGNEIGIHTYSHAHGVKINWNVIPAKRENVFTVEDWYEEMQLSFDRLLKPFDPNVKRDDFSVGIGIRKADIIGFRTPYLEYNNATFTAVRKAGFLYECSIEEGWQRDQDGTDFLWPYTLHNGSPGDAYNSKKTFGLDRPIVGKHSGLWELPSYALIIPPDEHCEKYGIPAGFRERMKKEQYYFDASDGRVTGLDWNLWFEYHMSKAEFVTLLKYNLDLRLQGNRCPFLFGCHSDIYSSKYGLNDMSPDEQKKLRATVQERREALEEFLEYALSKPEVRVTTMKNILKWLKNPSRL